MATDCDREFVDYLRRKVESLRAQLHQIECVDFPYEDPRSALERLKAVVDVYEATLDEAIQVGDDDAIVAAGTAINAKIVELHPILGFLLRSTNIRNSFEVYDPLKELAHALLPYKPGVILSSEWEYSPFTRPAISEDLADFVFIGLPASEANNALVLPLSGHELGHSVWRRCDVGSAVSPAINKAVFESYLGATDEFKTVFGRECTADTLLNEPDVLRNLSLACSIAARQCEEVFCDVLGVYLFSEAFIHAFEYLLIPALGGERSEAYPPLRSRLDYMIAAAKELGEPPRHRHEPPIREAERTLAQRDQFVLRMADTAPVKLFPTLVRKVAEHCTAQKVPSVEPRIISAAADAYRRYIPAESAQSVGNIVGAGWEIYREFDSFAPEFTDRGEALSVLNNLVFKSLEVLEFEAKVAR